MKALLQVRNLEKSYGSLKAVDGVSFDIEKGHCFGLLGPNGAGKTTTVEMLEGINQPTAGEILYKSQPIGETFRSEAGIMFQSTSLQDYMTVEEALRMFGSFYPKSRSFQDLVESCSLEPILKQDSRKLSGGQRQRLLLAIALVNDPEVVFLDEPTTGLDPQARRNFWHLIERIREEGKTIILTTHYMEEASRLCDELVFMDSGKIIAKGSPSELLDSCFNDVIVQLPQADIPVKLHDSFAESYSVQDMLEIPSQDVNATVQQLLESNIPLANLRVRARTLEDVFIELTGRELRQ